MSICHSRRLEASSFRPYWIDWIDWIASSVIHHSPWPEDYEEENFTATSASWESLFGIKMSEESKTGPWKESEYDGDTYQAGCFS